MYPGPSTIQDARNKAGQTGLRVQVRDTTSSRYANDAVTDYRRPRHPLTAAKELLEIIMGRYERASTTRMQALVRANLRLRLQQTRPTV
jgi:hypothetical protein